MSTTARQVVEALKQRYIAEGSSAATVTSDELINCLRALPGNSVVQELSLPAAISNINPDWVLTDDDLARLQAARDCLTMIFKLVDLEEEISSRIRNITPLLAAELISQPNLAITENTFP